MASSNRKRQSNSLSPPPDAAVRVSEREVKKPVRGTFSGPSGANVPLRVALDREVYAQVVAHAASSPDVEICGILAGTLCEDEEGPFVRATAAIRGEATRRANTHVTFTQETWGNIHRTLEQDYPNLEIVGWYHSHPGFGVEFSEMDIFIQKNFFRMSTQVAMVVDPLGGHVAMCVDTADGIRYIDRFWVEGRQHRCQVPDRAGAASATASGDAPMASGLDAATASGDAPMASGLDAATMAALQDTLQTVQTRLAQAIEMIDVQRAWLYRTVVLFGMVVSTAVIAWIGSSLWMSYTAPLKPPHLQQFVDIPVIIDGKAVKLGVGLVTWDVPPELTAAYVELEKQRRAAEAAADPAAAEKPPPAAAALPDQPAARRGTQPIDAPAQTAAIEGTVAVYSKDGWPEIDGHVLQLAGIGAVPPERMSKFVAGITRGTSYLECKVAAGDRYRCVTGQSEDLAQALLMNGEARTVAGAGDVYLAAEQQAREAKKGIWR